MKNKIAFKYLPFAFTFLLVFPLGCRKKQAAEDTADAAAAPVTVELAAAETQPIEVTVRGQGTLSPGQGATARVAASVAGRLLEVRVKEGDSVRMGQVVAVVDNRPQQAQARSAQYALSTSEAQSRQSELAARAAATDQDNSVRIARLAVQSAQQDRANSVQQASAALKAAQVDLQKLRAGARPQEIAQSAQAIVQAEATRNRAQTELDRVQFLFDKGITPKRQLDDATTALAVANSALETAQQASSLLKAGARQEDIQAGELRVQSAQESLALAQTAGATKIQQAQAALRQAQQAALAVAAKRQEAAAARQTVAQKRADYRAAQDTAQYAEIHAPFDGIVSRRTLSPGDMADPATPILEVSNPRAVNLVANLTGEDGLKVRPGMTAHVAASDAPNDKITGTVLSVGQVDPMTNLLAVRIAVSDKTGRLRLKAGGFATAEIVVRSEPHAVVVPRGAVIAREDKNVVYVVDSENTAHQRDVVTGVEQGDNVEIVSGLKAGEKIARLGQYEINDGAKVKEAGKDDAPEAKSDTKDVPPDSKDTKDAKDSKDAKTDAKPNAKPEADTTKGAK